MSTEVLSMQGLDPHSQCEFQPNFGMPADTSQMYTSPADPWSTFQSTNNRRSENSYLIFPVPSIASPPRHQTNFGALGADSQPHAHAHAQVSSQPAFKAANSVAYDQGVLEPFSVQASFEPVKSSSVSRQCSIIEPPYLESPTNDAPQADSNFEQKDMTTSKKPTKVGRKRKMEEAEPGSERAIYLEKNRKAASKCRSKQKKQQEDLVEQAREVQVRNKCLKAEVEMLKNGLRVFLEIAGQHQNCSDSRLALYLQREADRLAAGHTRTSSTPFSPTSSMQTPFTPVFESSPEDRTTSVD